MMFEIQHFYNTKNSRQAYQDENLYIGKAFDLFDKSHRIAGLRKLASYLLRRDHSLPVLADVIRGRRLKNSYTLGIRTVRIGQVVGSESRVQDFDREFNPLRANDRQRWTHVARLFLSGVPMPAVELLQVDGAYYVRDGHHRVSVYRALDIDYIDAYVTVLEWEAAPKKEPVAIMQPAGAFH